MAKGITETQVHTTADGLVAAGERPTVERIRQTLGTGSPNTVGRYLDSWWQQLGDRLQTQQSRLQVPAAPEAVIALAGEWWARALEAAQLHASQALAIDRTALEADRQVLARSQEQYQAEATALQKSIETAQQAERLAAAQAAELQRLAEQLTVQVTDLTQQRDAGQARCERLQEEIRVLAVRIEAQKTDAATEREAQRQHARGVEDRAYAEVDRARQEAKELRSQLALQAREHRAFEQTARQEQKAALATAATAQREAATQCARAEVLEQQLARLKPVAQRGGGKKALKPRTSATRTAAV